MKPRPLGTPGPLIPFDERDIVFARARLRPGTPAYEEYYRRRPENRSRDDRTRALPPLASRGTRRYRPGESALVEGSFAGSDLVAREVDRIDQEAPPALPEGLGAGAGDRQHRLPDESPDGLARYLKESALFLGADDVGIAPMEPAFVYTHRGRSRGDYGQPIKMPGSHAVVLVFGMREEYTRSAPEMICTAETARVYQQSAAAAFGLAEALRRLGISARAHVDSNYLVICPALAVLAGLGELGRNGFLIHRTLGPGVRLSVVTLDRPVRTDHPRCFGIAEFCRSCRKCARCCPARAIPEGEPEVIHGAEKWPIDAEACYHYWRTQGTDCGVCIRSCPFAKPDTLLHRGVRWWIRRTSRWNRLLLRGDDWIYGRSAPPRPPPLLGIGSEGPAEDACSVD